MKTKMILISFIFLISGCSNEGYSKDGKVYRNAVEIVHRSVHQKEMPELEWQFIDKESNEVIKTISLMELGYQKGGQLQRDKVELVVKQLAAHINQPLVNPRITREGEILEGQKKVVLLEQELIEKIELLFYYNKNLVIPLVVEEPVVTVEDLKEIKNTILGSFVTYFDPTIRGRSENIRLSSASIDHLILGPNEVFSFNEVVGQRTKERGYQEASVIVNKQFVTGIGGGICQTSSTLYNAVDFAGLKIVERHPHSRDIGYVPKNRDATVSWGGPDFKFKNDYDFPILISTETDLKTGKIEIKVYGPSSSENYVKATP